MGETHCAGLTGRTSPAAWRGAACAIALSASIFATAACAQSALLPPECKGKTGAELDQCVRDLTQPSGKEVTELIELVVDPRQLMNCLKTVRADEAYCIARNEIIIECQRPAKYADFDACTKGLIARQPLPRASDCNRAAPAQRNQCALRNKVFADCQSDTWRYFVCLGEKMYPQPAPAPATPPKPAPKSTPKPAAPPA